jgi:hypothetical protein
MMVDCSPSLLNPPFLYHGQFLILCLSGFRLLQTPIEPPRLENSKNTLKTPATLTPSTPPVLEHGVGEESLGKGLLVARSYRYQ